jgi:hypothetical protein
VLSSFIGAAVLSTAGAPGFYIVIALAMGPGAGLSSNAR